MLLYLHVPFCQKKCAYCAFYSLGFNELKHIVPHAAQNSAGSIASAFIDRYCHTLIKELSLQAATQPLTEVTTIFFGGGTPSLLPACQIEAILNTVQTLCPVSSDAEITIEANPESALNDGWLSDIRSAGINRLSLGIQSFQADDLALLGRCHSLEQSDLALNLAVQAGFSSLSLDLMWGLPQRRAASTSNQPDQPFVERWLQTLSTALQYRPQHISAYGLILEENTPLHQLAEAGGLIFPTEDEEKAMYLDGVALLSRHGFGQYEVSNYALAGHECRHNLGYWQGEDYLGLGPSAVSTLGSSRLTNCADFNKWVQGIEKGEPDCDKEELTPRIMQKERLMLSLRLTSGITLADWESIYQNTFQVTPFIGKLLGEKLATLTNSHFALTPAGMLVSNAIIARLFEEII